MSSAKHFLKTCPNNFWRKSVAQILRLAHKWLRSGIAINVALSLLILLPEVALAYSNNPGDPPPKTMGTSGGSRWCEP
jgi:hypothetical protein